MNDTHTGPPPAEDQSVTIVMSETVTYRRTFTLAEVAELLNLEDGAEAVREAINSEDGYDSSFGLDPEDTCPEGLLDAMMDHVEDVTDRDWSFAVFDTNPAADGPQA